MAERAPAVVIVGAGLMGRWHAHAARRAGARVQAIVDPDLARARRIAGSDALVCASLEDLPDLPAACLLQVCAPPGAHRRIIEMGLDRGLHVLCEKPLAADAPEVGRLLDLAAERRRLLCPVHQFVLQPAMRRSIAELRASGGLVHVEFAFCTAGFAHQGGLSARDLLLEILPHPLALLASLVGSELAACEWAVQQPTAGTLLATGSVGAVSTSIFISTAARPTEARCTLYCGTRTIRHDFYHGFRVVQQGQPGRLDKTMRPFRSGSALLSVAAANLGARLLRREYAYPGLTDLCRAFYAAVLDGAEAPISPAEVRGTYAARDALARRMVA